MAKVTMIPATMNPITRMPTASVRKKQVAGYATYENITNYYIHMECAGPKLAHYAGYLMANKLLPWVEPGYREDWHQTQIYDHQIREYFGINSICINQQ